MAVVKVVEVLAQSPNSWEDAAKAVLADVSPTLRHIQSICFSDLQCVTEENNVTQYRLNAKVSFVVQH